MQLYTSLLWIFLTSPQVKQQLDTTARYPCVAYAIYKHESHNGKSELARKYNNLYGFKGGKYNIGRTKSGYSKYASKEESIKSYVFFETTMIEKYNLDTSKKYITFVARRYSAKSQRLNWIKRVKHHMKTCN